MWCKIKTDISCRVYVDDVLQGVAVVNELFKIQLEKGQYLVRYESLYDSYDYVERTVTIIDSDIVELINLLPIIDKQKLVHIPFVDENHLWGYKVLFSNIISIKPQFTGAYYFFDNKYARVLRSGLWGIIDTKGNPILKCDLDSIVYLENDWFIVRKQGRFGLFYAAAINEGDNVSYIDGATWLFFERPEKRTWDNLEYYSVNDTIIINEDDTSHIFSSKIGHFILTPKGIVNPLIREDGFIEISCDGKEGLLDRSFHEVVPIQYHSIGLFIDGFAIVSVKKPAELLYGFINKNGEAVIPCKYQSINDFSDGFACASRKDKNGLLLWGFINTKGDEVIPFIYSEAFDFYDGLAPVKREGFHGFIDTKGNEIVPVDLRCPVCYDKRRKFNRGLYRFSSKSGFWSRHGFINAQGIVIAPPDSYNYDLNIERDDNNPVFPQLHMVSKDGLYGFINKVGKIVVPIIYDFVDGSEKQSYISVKKQGKYGYLDKTGKEVFPIVYDSYYIKTDLGLIVVEKTKKYALFSLAGKQITGFLYDNIHFYGDRAFVEINGGVGVIDANGRELIPTGHYGWRHGGYDDYSGVKSVTRNGQPGFLLITNLRFYPSDTDQYDCQFDPDSSILDVKSINNGWDSSHHYIDAETGVLLAPECPTNVIVQRIGHRIQIKV